MKLQPKRFHPLRLCLFLFGEKSLWHFSRASLELC